MASTAYQLGSGLLGFPPQHAEILPRAYSTGTITPTQVGPATSSEQTFTVSGLLTTDAVHICKPSHQAGLGIANARVSAADTLAITFLNATAATITPTAEAYKVFAVKCA